MKVLNMILLISIILLSNMLIAAVSASISYDHCFDHDQETSFCYESQKECETERKNDLMAESKCYRAID
jgi:hypothetical protein